MQIKAFFDTRTSTLSYVVYDSKTHDAVIIDPVLDYDAPAGKTWSASAEQLVEFVRSNHLVTHLILETHAHADHLSAAQFLIGALPGAVLGISTRITEVQAAFKPLFGLPAQWPADGSQFDRLLQDDEVVHAGSLSFRVIPTPGHTPACSSYLFRDAVFTGDALFMPDSGTGRCDFPGGDARALYRSVTQNLYSLADNTRTFTGHDYQPGGRELRFESTIGAHKAENLHLPASRAEEDYVAFRTGRDVGLNAPALLYPAVQVNIDAGRLPEPEANGVQYLRIPLNRFK